MRHLLYLSLLAALLLAACTGGPKHADMQQRLHGLNLRNRSDSVLTVKDRDEAQNLARYFERHGTANEQMLSHYLLGRAYADLHEAPMALHCYQVAAAHADTAAADCDFAQLSRVYGQSSTIFYDQGLYRNQIEYLNIATQYAWKGKDTLSALICYSNRAEGYSCLQLKDSAILIYKEGINQLKVYHYYKVAAGYSCALARKLIELNDLESAYSLLLDYKRNSGFFDSDDNIAKGREIYYHDIGNYHLKLGQYDSAEYYFRKELCEGKDFNNQNCGSHGLAELFYQQHNSDSAAKYFAYSYAMNDSFFVQMSAHEVEQAKAMYDYTRQQELAEFEKRRADKKNRELIVIGAITLLLFFLAMITIYAYYLQKRKIDKLQKKHEKLRTDIENLRKVEKELKYKNYQCESLRILISQKEEDAKQLKNKIDKYALFETNLKTRMNAYKEKLGNEDIYRKLKKNAIRGEKLSEEDWQQIESFLIEQSPDFYSFFQGKKYIINSFEYKVCVLVCLFITPVEISHLLGVDKTYVSKARMNSACKLFAGKSSRDLDKPLLNICWPES